MIVIVSWPLEFVLPVTRFVPIPVGLVISVAVNVACPEAAMLIE
jgi:hypothetical protein